MPDDPDVILSKLPATHDGQAQVQLLMAGANTFTRMFPGLAPFEPDDAALVALSDTMRDTGGLDHPTLPAGYTYLGQFIDHDLTLDLTPLGAPSALNPAVNFRTARLDLDSVYGLGRQGTPFLYDGNDPEKLAIGTTTANRAADLPRSPSGVALIGDPRNDENLVVAQLHLAFLKAHNRILTDLVRLHLPAGLDRFDETYRIVRFHYQWIVLHDFLKRIADPAVVDDVLANGRQFYTFDAAEGPRIPVEFSSAAFRFGHSLVRGTYNHNRNFGAASLNELFQFTQKSGGIRSRLDDIWVIDFRRYFNVVGHDTVPGGMNLARRIDNFVEPTLFSLPKELPGPTTGSLPARNLLRGKQNALPSGQDVADAMGLAKLSPADLAAHPADRDVVVEHGFDVRSPLWWYLLKEAQVTTGGERLGPVGSRIVAEVIVGVLEGDPTSFLSIAPNWTPELPSGFPASYTMADLLNRFVELNPLG